MFCTGSSRALRDQFIDSSKGSGSPSTSFSSRGLSFSSISDKKHERYRVVAVADKSSSRRRLGEGNADVYDECDLQLAAVGQRASGDRIWAEHRNCSCISGYGMQYTAAIRTLTQQQQRL